MKSFPSLGRAFSAHEEATETGPSGFFVLSANECSWEENELGPTIEEFASAHQLPPRWVELRNACRQLAGRADFWYRADLRDAVRPPAVKASDILHSSLKGIGRSAQGGMPQACPQNAVEASGAGYESADPLQAGPGKAKQLSLTRTHEAYMRRAISLARIALANGDTPVGSLVIRKRKIIAEGFEAVKMQVDVSGHAELIAIRNACSALQTFDLSGCTLCTTAEPCFMCSYAVRHTRISKVIIGRPTPRVGGISSLHPILTDAQIPGWGRPPDIVSGVLEAECCALNS
jgi:tRNA(adenine34) deaminase